VALVPPGPVTVTSTVPGAWDGTTATNCVLELLTIPAPAEPNFAPVALARCSPVIVTVSPPEPLLGLTAFTTGTSSTTSALNMSSSLKVKPGGQAPGASASREARAPHDRDGGRPDDALDHEPASTSLARSQHEGILEESGSL
jgi:hypothetical protein